jgi:hypothetical protein
MPCKSSFLSQLCHVQPQLYKHSGNRVILYPVHPHEIIRCWLYPVKSPFQFHKIPLKFHEIPKKKKQKPQKSLRNPNFSPKSTAPTSLPLGSPSAGTLSMRMVPAALATAKPGEAEQKSRHILRRWMCMYYISPLYGCIYIYIWMWLYYN